jgi:hypothetical protein
MVQDYLAEDFDNAKHHRDRIHEDMVDIWYFLKRIGETKTT